MPVADEKMTNINDEKQISEIAEFFNGRSVLITGAAGFVGGVLLETLLRCCPGIEHIYIVLRAKKGSLPQDRKKDILAKKIFGYLNSNKPKVLEKLIVFGGDVTLPNLGLNEDDLEVVVANVSVVIHCAASISFRKPLRYMLVQNVQGTQNVVDVCKKLPKLAAFVNTSSAYANSNRPGCEIPEKIDRTEISAKEFLEALTFNASDVVLDDMQDKCLPHWPNNYTFTKALTEDLLSDCDIPVAIVKPSMILSSWKGILPGYTEEGSGFIDVSIGIGKGFIRVMHVDPDKLCDIVPVDVVANTIISAAWAVGAKKRASPFVVNCTSGSTSCMKWREPFEILFGIQECYPMPKMYQKPFLVMRKHAVTYWASALVNHYAPAVCIDLALKLMGKKPRLLKLYRFYDLALSHLVPFLTQEWKFRCDNFIELSKLQCLTDCNMLPVDLQGYSLKALHHTIKDACPFYDWDLDKRKQEERIPIAYKRAMVTTFIKWMTIFWFLFFLFFIATRSVFRTSVF